ncbi:hypothetical protein PHLGIDRAFT_14562 [Phlebiopsis gigantea 11061_1 CR5-6]|uniref:Uncharacterized protein n=1 Tax=Phlebiopsis gigantea (strain 11061_1 CR5-6) TaxID=745531 RepID=A0A0C3PHP6_PHLG1|nr:hypothetical protein PHLGIDRAFT_14562 [Phlebiopsis gigantea 11061_1 CR5-6]
MPAAARVYAEQLLPRGHGLPLWEPEPSELGEVEIGDVGFIDEGGFCRIFSTTRHKDDPANVFGVPEGFSPLEYNERALRHTSIDYLLPGPIYSSSMRQFSIGGGPSVTPSSRSTCARTGTRGSPLHGRWDNIDLDDLILVSGWTKTSQWALAACTNFGRAHEVTLDASFGAVAGAKFEVKLRQDVEMSVDQRSGPSRVGKDGDEALPRDQCLFLRYYKMKRTKFGVKKIVAGSGPRRQSSYDDTQKRSHTGVLADEHRTHGAPRQHSYDDPQTSLEEDCVEEYDVPEEITEEPRALPQVG